MIAHGSLVMRRLLHGERSLRAGYVEGVAVRLDRRRAGHASTVMAALEALAPAYDLLALSSSEDGVPFYESRGWQRVARPDLGADPERHRAHAGRRRQRLREVAGPPTSTSTVRSPATGDPATSGEVRSAAGR